jgi:DNA invertase Pin-like site-specific DNA recombinase
VLVVAKLDRLGRNSIEVQIVLKQLTDAGVRVVAIGDGLDSASGMGASILKLLVSILASFAELEREVIRVRLLDGRLRAKSDKRVYSSEPQLGLQVSDDGRNLVISTGELAAIDRARTLREQGLSYRVIGRTLDEEGLHPRRSPRWQPAVVRRMVLRGYQVPNDQAA